MNNSGQQSLKNGQQYSAGELADAIGRILQRAPYTPGVSALVSVLAQWISNNSRRPVPDAQVYGAVLETVVEAVSRSNARETEVADVAA